MKTIFNNNNIECENNIIPHNGLIIKLILLFITPIISFSQINIKGKIADEKGEAIEYVNVLIKDSLKILGSSTTDSKGNFIIKNIKKGKYTLETYLMGYKNSKKIVDIEKDIDIGSLELSRDMEMLREVELMSNIPPVLENKGDKMVVDIANNPFAKGRMTDQLLNYVPFMTANQQEGITLLGSTPLILINDRRLFMSGSELLNFLQSIPAEDIKNIEIYTDPLARFDAEGVSGVVNININKKALIGLKGFIGNYNNLLTKDWGGKAGIYQSGGLSGSLNYRDERWYFSTFFWYGKAFTPNLFENNVNFPDKGNGFNNENEYQADFTGKGVRFEAGRDITENQNIILNYAYNNYLNDDESNYTNNEYDSIKSPTNITKGLVDVYDDTRQHMVGINYNWNISKNGENMTIIGDYYKNSKRKDQTINNKYYKSPSIGIINREWDGFIGLPMENDIYSIQLDYNLPTDAGKFSFGGKYSFSSVDSRTDYYDVDINTGDRIKDYIKSIDFRYSEGISAAYVSYSNGGLRIGLRYEYTSADYKDRVLKQDVDKSYGGFFPSVSYSYSLFENRDGLTFSYNRRLARPRYSDFNGLFYMSENSLMIGNPDIRPSFPNTFRVTYNLMKRYTIIGGFTYTTNMLSQVTYKVSDNSVVTQRRNIDDVYQYMISANLNQPVLEWWNINLSGSVFYNDMKGGFKDNIGEDINIDHQGINSNISLKNMFMLYGYAMNLEGTYTPEGIYGYAKMYQRYQINFFVNKNFFDNKLSIGIYLTDILQSDRYKVEMNLGNTVNLYNKQPIRMIGFNIRYNFDYGRKDTKGMELKKSIEEEINRV